MDTTNPWGDQLSGAVEETVHVAVSTRTAYDAWSRFEVFPRYMRHVRRVDQVRPAVTRWFVRLGPVPHEYYAEVREQHPDSLIAWRSLGRRLKHEGEVSFRPVGEDRAALRVTIRFLDHAALLDRSLAGLVGRLVRGELDRFREFVESVGDVGETWRGTIHDGRVQHLEKRPPPYPGWVHG